MVWILPWLNLVIASYSGKCFAVKNYVRHIHQSFSLFKLQKKKVVGLLIIIYIVTEECCYDVTVHCNTDTTLHVNLRTFVSWSFTRVSHVGSAILRSWKSLSSVQSSLGQKVVADPRQYSHSWFRAPSGSLTIFFCSFRLLRVSKWGLLFDDGRLLTTTGHCSCTGSDSSGCHSHPLTHWLPLYCSQLVSKFLAVYEVWSFITGLTRVRHCGPLNQLIALQSFTPWDQS